jgi:hypothetical protein
MSRTIKLLMILTLFGFFLLGITLVCYSAEKATCISEVIATLNNEDLKDGETVITRIIDYQSRTVLWVANSKTFGHAVAIAILPMDQTVLASQNPIVINLMDKTLKELNKNKP